MNRCPWCTCNDKMTRYHDEEWGVPLYDDQKLPICRRAGSSMIIWNPVLGMRSLWEYRMRFRLLGI